MLSTGAARIARCADSTLFSGVTLRFWPIPTSIISPSAGPKDQTCWKDIKIFEFNERVLFGISTSSHGSIWAIFFRLQRPRGFLSGPGCIHLSPWVNEFKLGRRESLHKSPVINDYILVGKIHGFSCRCMIFPLIFSSKSSCSASLEAATRTFWSETFRC